MTNPSAAPVDAVAAGVEPPRPAPAPLLPGLLLCVAIALAARALEMLEARLAGQPFVEALVLAILVGTALRTAWSPGERWRRGIEASATTLLEVAVVLLGASLSLQTLAAAGLPLLVGIVLLVPAAIAASFAIARGLGLPRRMAVLVACGNAICGNSAIVAVAPLIGADAEDVASAIAFTAILGVGMVLGLPLLISALALSPLQYGVLAGLTVYAVPQVLAATLPVSTLSVEVGTVVKLARVLMLGPVVLAISLREAHRARGRPAAGGALAAGASGRPPHRAAIPWFITGFMAMAALRALGLLPAAGLRPISLVASALTVVAMAALGLGVDVRAVARVGGRVAAAVTASLVVLLVMSAALIRLLHLA